MSLAIINRRVLDIRAGQFKSFTCPGKIGGTTGEQLGTGIVSEPFFYPPYLAQNLTINTNKSFIN